MTLDKRLQFSDSHLLIYETKVFELVEERTSKHEARLMGTGLLKDQRENRMNYNEQMCREGGHRCTHQHLHNERVALGNEKERGTRKIFTELIAEKFLNLFL